MAKPTLRIALGALSFWAASLCWAASEKPVSIAGSFADSPGEPAPAETGPSPAAGREASQAEPQGTERQGAVAPQAASKPLLGEAFIVQNHLQVYLNGPAAISVYNANGQQIFHADSRASMESVPLMGMNTGFLYLTVRAGQTELTKKLVYTGK